MDKKHILIVEDNEEIRDLICEVLTLKNFYVSSVAHGQEALAFLNEQKNLPDLILLDLMMPVMNGQEFLEIFHQQKRYNKIPVIVVSAYVDPLKKLHCTDFLTKPIDFYKLISLSRKYTQDKTHDRTLNEKILSTY